MRRRRVEGAGLVKLWDFKIRMRCVKLLTCMEEKGGSVPLRREWQTGGLMVALVWRHQCQHCDNKYESSTELCEDTNVNQLHNSITTLLPNPPPSISLIQCFFPSSFTLLRSFHSRKVTRVSTVTGRPPGGGNHHHHSHHSADITSTSVMTSLVQVWWHCHHQSQHCADTIITTASVLTPLSPQWWRHLHQNHHS